MSNKADLFEVESWLYDEYGSIDEVIETIEYYFDEEENSYAEFIEEVLDYYPPYDWDDADDADYVIARNKSGNDLKLLNIILLLYIIWLIGSRKTNRTLR